MTLTKRQQVAAGGLIFNTEGKLLFVKRVHNDEFMPGVWEIPGGGIELEESPTVGLKREIHEECGIEVTVSPEPLALGEYFIERNGERVHRVEIIFSCIQDTESEITLSDEHDEYRWVAPTEFNSLEMTEYMHKIVSDALQRTRK